MKRKGTHHIRIRVTRIGGVLQPSKFVSETTPLEMGKDGELYATIRTKRRGGLRAYQQHVQGL